MTRAAPSRTAAERHNPPSRRKACLPCVKAKRRCDEGWPSCTRCVGRGISCHYAPSSALRKSAHTEKALSCHDTQHPDQLLSQHSDFPLGQPGLPSESQFTSSWPDVIEFNPQQPGGDFGQAFDLDGQLLSYPALDIQPAVSDVQSSYNLMQLMMMTPPGSVMPTRSPGYRPLKLQPRLESQLQYLFDAYKAAPAQMVLTNGTPWSHPSLYLEDMPESIRDLYAACSMHMSKNFVNSDIIVRLVESKAAAIVRTPHPSTAREWLARTHALLLYQIMRLFDDDVSVRMTAERDIPTLDAAASAMAQHIEWDEEEAEVEAEDEAGSGGSSASLEDPKHLRDRWIVAESMRRTFLLTAFFLQLYSLLTGTAQPSSDCGARMYQCRSFTISAPLWEAVGPFDFAVAWKAQKRWVVRSRTCDEMLGMERAQDVDQLGKLVLTALIGVEESRAWFALRGGML